MDAKRVRLSDRVYDVIDDDDLVTMRQIAIRCGTPGYLRRALVRQHVYLLVKKGFVKITPGCASRQSLYTTRDIA